MMFKGKVTDTGDKIRVTFTDDRTGETKTLEYEHSEARAKLAELYTGKLPHSTE